MTRRIDPEVAAAEMRAAGVEPLVPYPGTREPWLSRCLVCGREVSPMLGNIRRGTGGCRFCAGRAPIDPETARRDFAAAGAEMIGKYVDTTTPTLCRCLTCGNSVSPRLGDIRSGRGACVFCAGQAPVDPETARRDFAAAGVEMVGEYVRTVSPVLCRCLTCGNEVTPRLGDVRRGQGPCIFCAGNAPVDPETAWLEFAEAGVEMIGEYVSARTPTVCRCLTCGHEVSPTLDNVRRGQGACAFCAGHGPIDPETARIEFAAVGVEMTGDFAAGHIPTPGRCLKCGNEISPRLDSIRWGQGPCRFCNPPGFKPDKPGTLYLFRHDDLHALKIGITNQTTERLIMHERTGWKLIDIWFYDIGEEARVVEHAVLDSWKIYSPPVAAEDMPQAGYTETVSLDDVSEADAVAFIESLVAAEE